MANIFQSIRVTAPKRTLFDLSHESKLTTDMGRLTPILCHPLVPSDKIRLNTEVFIRFAPMFAPVMHRINAYQHNFFLPNRLLYKNWKEFYTKGKDGKTVHVYPRWLVSKATLQAYSPNFMPGSLADYLGFPVWDEDQIDNLPDDFRMEIDPLPFLAYYKIWQTYYADSNLTNFPLDEDFMFDDGIIDLTAGEASHRDDLIVFEALIELRQRCWEKDYFTSALPFPQRGEDVTLPIVGTAPVSGIASVAPSITINDDHRPVSVSQARGLPTTLYGQDTKGGYQPISFNGTIEGEADLSNASSSTINELRRAFAAQRWLELKARAGYRYIEQIFATFGVKSSDARLQRPEYLGGAKQPVIIGEVVQTSQTKESAGPGDVGSALGELAGKAVALGRNNGVKYFAEEHGYVFTILSVLPRSSYSQGLSRLFQKFEPEDYANPYFAHLGEQEIKNSELYFSGNEQVDNSTFGYQSRYSEYKYIPGSYHGDMRTNLNFWHLGRQFTKLPGLNEFFVTVNPLEVDRIFNVREYAGTGGVVDHLWIQVYHNFKALRPLPRYGTPRNI